MKFSKNIIFLYLIGIMGMFGIANAATVQNEVSVKASTGGNNAANVREGSSSGSVYIETIVDGQVVGHADEKIVSKDGEAINIEKNIEYKSSVTEVAVQAKTSTDQKSEEETEDQDEEIIIEEEPPVGLLTASQEVEEQEQIISKSKPLLVSIVDFFRNLFSRFFT